MGNIWVNIDCSLEFAKICFIVEKKVDSVWWNSQCTAVCDSYNTKREELKGFVCISTLLLK